MSAPTACRLEGVEFSYGGAWRLEIPALEVMAGEILAVIGPTGAGKSTLLRILDFLDRPSAGRIEFDGRWVELPAPLEVRRSVGMVFQRPLMLSGTVRANIALSLRLRGRRDDGRVDGLLRDFDLGHLGDREARLVSGGEMQRVALARALACRPRLLLLDEPAASLDPGHAWEIEGIIRAAPRSEGVALVLATHNLAQARRLADRVAMLSAGRLIEVQPTTDFFERPLDPISAAYLAEARRLETPRDDETLSA